VQTVREGHIQRELRHRADPHVERCGCILKGFRGNCLIRGSATYAGTAPVIARTADLYAASWRNGAPEPARQLAIDEPINWVTHLGTHNAFNSFSDGISRGCST